MPQNTRFIPLTFENGLLSSQEASVLPPGFAPVLENLIPEPSGCVRARRGWQQGSVAGSIPATRKTRGIGTFALTTAFSTPAIRQAVSDGGLAGTTAAEPWSFSTAADSLLLAFVTYVTSGTPTVTPPSGWTEVGTVVENTTRKARIFSIEGAPSRSGTQTFTFSASVDDWTLVLMEITGVALTSALDKSASSTGTSATASSGTTAATTQNDEIAVALIFAAAASTTQSAPTNGFALAHSNNEAQSVGIYTKTLTATGAQSTDVTMSGSPPWVGRILTYKAKSISQTGGRHLIAHDDGTNFDIWAIDRDALGSGAWASVDANRAATDRSVPVAFASGLGYILYSHKDFATTRKWNGTAASDVGGTAPEGRAIVFYKNRFFIGGAATNSSKLHYSALGNPEDWTTAGDAGSEEVGQADGEPIEDIAPSEDGLIIAKLSSLWFLSGDGPDNFALHHLNPGRGYPGRCLLPTPYGVVIAGKKQVWLWAGGAPVIISDAIEGSYNIGGAYVTTAFADDVAYICDSGTGTTWCYDLRRGVWWIETVKTSAERPATIFAHGDRLLYGPTAGTVASFLNYRDEPGGDRVRDVGQTQDLKAHTREEWGAERRKITPKSLWLAIRQRGGDDGDAPLVITPVYDGVTETARNVVPLAAGSGVFTDRVDVGDGKYHDRVQYLCEQALGTGDNALLEIERAFLEIDVEEHTN